MRKRLMAIVMTLTLVIAMMPYSAFAGTYPVTSTTTGSITINNAVNEDTFAAYKVVDITYDGDTNHLTYAFNAAFASYFSSLSPALTVEDLAGLESETNALKDVLAGLPQYIKANAITPVKTGIVAGGKVAFTDLAMGEYLIIPTSTTSVYQLILQKLEPRVNSGGYVLDDVTVNAKKAEISVTKTADKTSVTKKEAVTYTITADIPNYLLSAQKKTFRIVDTLESGLTLVHDSVDVKFSDDASVTAGMYSLDKNASGFTFSVSNEQYNSTWQTKAAGNIKLVITYKATLDDNTNSDDVIANYSTQENNKVDYTYVTYPFTTDAVEKTKSAEVDVNSFIIKIDKCAKGSSGTKLPGAKFSLYRTLRAGEAATTVDIPGTGVIKKQGLLLEANLTTDEYGVVEFKKYEANDTKYDYYLVETQAPAGYNLLQSAVKVNFADTDVATTNGVYTVQIENSTGFQLPITGDTGTILMSVIGLVLMGGAVVLLLLRKRKASRAK